MGKPFTNVIVFGIYQKGKIQQERIDRRDIVEVSNPMVEPICIGLC